MSRTIILILAITMLGGCGMLSTPQQPLGADVIYTVGGPKKSDEGNISLISDGKTVVNFHAPADSSGTFRSIVSKYNESSDAVYVSYHEISADLSEAYTQFIMAMQSADKGYDLMLFDTSWTTNFASQGLISALDEYISESGINLNNYLENAIEASRYQGSMYLMPVEVGMSMLYFRNDLLNSAPVTWEGLHTVCANAMDDYLCKHSLVFGGKVSYESVLLILDIVNIYGGRFLDDSGSPALDRPRIAQALKAYKDMYTSIYVPSSIHYMSAANATSTFTAGNSLILIGGSQAWKQANGKDSKVVGKFALAPIPKTDSYTDHGQLLMCSALAISANSPNQAVAWDFVQHITGEIAQETLAVSGGFLPSLMKIYDDPDAKMVNAFFSSENFRNSLFNATIQPVTPHYFGYISVLQEQFGEYLSGRLDIDTTLDAIERELNRVLKVQQ